MRAPVAYETFGWLVSSRVSIPAACMADRSLSTRWRRMRARSSVHTGLVIGPKLLSPTRWLPFGGLQVHGHAGDQPGGGVEHHRFARFEAGVAVVDGLPELHRHGRSGYEHPIHIELIAAERADRVREEGRVLLASAVRVAVRTHPPH